MQDKGHRRKHDQFVEHSLPGTNQAGEGPGSREKNDHENGPGGKKHQYPDQLDEHSLPGTNQAGEGPGSHEQNDQADSPDGGTQHPDRRREQSLPGANHAEERPTVRAPGRRGNPVSR